MKFRKRPVVIEAIQFTGSNHEEVFAWTDGSAFPGTVAWTGGAAFTAAPLPDDDAGIMPLCLWIPTLEGHHLARPGDWIIRGVNGEFYPCKPNIFAATYEPMAEGAAASAQSASLADVEQRFLTALEALLRRYGVITTAMYETPVREAFRAALDEATSEEMWQLRATLAVYREADRNVIGSGAKSSPPAKDKP